MMTGGRTRDSYKGLRQAFMRIGHTQITTNVVKVYG